MPLLWTNHKSRKALAVGECLVGGEMQRSLADGVVPTAYIMGVDLGPERSRCPCVAAREGSRQQQAPGQRPVESGRGSSGHFLLGRRQQGAPVDSTSVREQEVGLQDRWEPRPRSHIQVGRHRSGSAEKQETAREDPSSMQGR